MNRIVITYFLLSLLLIGSSVILAMQVRHFMNERVDPTEKFEARIQDPEVIQDKIKQKAAEQQKDILLTFSQTRSFRELATPAPRPTPTPIPPPSPTPVVVGKGWEIVWATKKMVILKKYDGTEITAFVGQDMESQYGNFKILEINPDPDIPRVKVKDLATGITSEITQQVKRGK